MNIIDTHSGSLSDCTSPLILGVSADKDDYIAVSTCPALRGLAHSVGVKSKAGETQRTSIPYNFQAPFVIFADLGDLYTDCGATEMLREVVGAATHLAETKEVVLLLPVRSREEIVAIVEGTLLDGYHFDKYLTKKFQRLERISLPSEAPALDAYTRSRVEAVVKAVADIRDLVNTSPSALYPETLTKWMESTAKDLSVKVKIWNCMASRAKGFGGIAAAGRSSRRKPVLVKMTCEPAEYRVHIALMGKGITFDSGRYALKPPSSMVTMKVDMTGVATIGNTVLAVTQLQLPMEIMAWLTCMGNMVSGGTTRSDGIIIMKNGTSVEVNNTDAEGRLVMASGIVVALVQKPGLLVDTATLTGAQVAALESRIAGAIDSAKDEYFVTAKRVDELTWPYPLSGHLAEDLKPKVADMHNPGTEREDGMSLAGLFLRHFTKDAHWVHVDIAGPGFNSGLAWGCTPKGGTGYGLRALVDLLENFHRPLAWSSGASSHPAMP